MTRSDHPPMRGRSGVYSTSLRGLLIVSTITPIRVTHDLVWQVFYSIEGRKVNEAPVTGPGELRMMAVKIPINVPSVSIPVEPIQDLTSSVLQHHERLGSSNL